MTDNKKVQDLTMNTLNVLINYCEEYDLRYYFTGGALIGVLRHKGFIPWDDDIDLGLPRKDFVEQGYAKRIWNLQSIHGSKLAFCHEPVY